MNLFRRGSVAGLAFQATAQSVSFGLAQATVPIALWRGQGSNLITVGGKLTLDGRPVAGAAVRVDEYEVPAPTGADGGFGFLHDQTVLARRIVRVANAGAARVAGQPLSRADQTRLQGVAAGVSTVYNITLEQQPQLKRGARDVKLSGLLTFADKTTVVPPVALWDYVLRGVIQDEQGKPIANAIASIATQGGEQGALSTVTDETGHYLLRFFPQSDDRYKVRVGYGPNLYTSANPITFVEAKSAEMDLVLSAAGTTLKGTGPGGALAPKEVPGAEYIGTMTGVANAQGPVPADVTWPDAKGRFTVTIPAVSFPGPVSFYQAELRFFSAEQAAPGLPITGAVVPTRLDPDMPRGLNPIPVSD